VSRIACARARVRGPRIKVKLEPDLRIVAERPFDRQIAQAAQHQVLLVRVAVGE
jgi:hypothetical protein